MSYPKDIYDDTIYAEILARLGKLSAEDQPLWGKMDSAQMLAHCAEVAEVSSGKPLTGTPWFVRIFLAGMIRKMIVSEKPYHRNSRTHPQYVITEPADFDREKKRLLALLEKMKASGPRDGVAHPLFGELSPEEKGWAGYKHLDHHLSQFGV